MKLGELSAELNIIATMSRPTLVLVFAEEVFRYVAVAGSAAEARSHASGIRAGAALCADVAHAYVWPDDVEWMREEQPQAACDEAVAAADRLELA